MFRTEREGGQGGKAQRAGSCYVPRPWRPQPRMAILAVPVLFMLLGGDGCWRGGRGEVGGGQVSGRLAERERWRARQLLPCFIARAPGAEAGQPTARSRFSLARWGPGRLRWAAGSRLTEQQVEGRLRGWPPPAFGPQARRGKKTKGLASGLSCAYAVRTTRAHPDKRSERGVKHEFMMNRPAFFDS